MGQPASRLGDMHVCPQVTVLVPHVGGPIVMGAFTVLTGGQPQARVGDLCICVGPPDVIALGSMTVLVSGQMAARIGDLTAHGGTIVGMCPTVLIGG
ncbi:type VI secretion protein [Labrys miyagiensis]|uniref:Type VI secretion protein n=2 Tax=Labrys miyagiensis TaxID=346912 RepID=A0ABQ6CTP4_9HYPH|nr:type VI secretion protein [Labrys miyagiensis]